MSENASVATRCARCDTPLEECACCDERDCGAAICYECLHVALGEVLPQPHPHGG